MLAQVHTPEILEAHQLDTYLSEGWFRMGQTIFTTNFLRVKDEIHSTIWLRLKLNEYQPDSTQQKLFKRNAAFKTLIQPAVITAEKEILYQKYKATLEFQASDSLQFLLLGQKVGSIYNTYEVTVHNGDRLIACGYFDLGASTAEGITSFYDPDYKKNSLGKYLIYQKIQYCKNLGMTYFYPGYFVPGNHHFDYKLSIGKEVLEFLQLSSQSWMSMDHFTPEDVPYDVMGEKLKQLQALILRNKLPARVLKYEFFDTNFIPELRNTGLLDFPLILLCTIHDENLEAIPVIYYDVRDARYHVVSCVPAWRPLEAGNDPAFYSSYFLMPGVEFFSSAEVEITAEIVLKLMERWSSATP